MVDATTLILAATFAQTVVITLTLLVFIFQFRSQETAIKESSYQGLMGRYNEYIMTQVNSPDLNNILARRLSRLRSDGAQVSPDDARMMGNLLIVYGIIEESYLLYSKNWIDKVTWEQWAAWLKVLCEEPLFRLIHETSQGMFDPGFQAYVSEITNTG